MSDSFFDSNTLLYVASSEVAKADRVWQLLEDRGAISVQVLNEMTAVARRKFKMSWADTRAMISKVSDLLTIVPITVETHWTGLRLAERYGFSVYDSFIVAAALMAGCDRLWSEDMQDGLLVENQLRIFNPFKSA